MVKVFESVPTNFSGDQVSGGTITNFSSTGIKDNASLTTLVVSDGKITVPSISVDTVEGNIVVRGDVKVYGILDAGFVRTTEIITNQRYEKQYLQFAGNNNNGMGSGLLWLGPVNKQFVLKSSPDRLWSSENIDLLGSNSYMIDEVPVLTRDTLGGNVVNSSLQNLGILTKLNVNGPVTISDHIHFNPVSQRLGIGTDNPNGLLSLLDFVNNVEIIIDSDSSNGYGKVGTYSTKGFELVTDDTARITITETGNITLGQEFKDSTIIRAYGKIGVGVRNPTEQLEVAGNIKFGNRLFANDIASPTSGSYQVGDIVWNSMPRPGTYIGWVCTGNGSPGVWNGFGLIDS
jgi:hypothetical protein